MKKILILFAHPAFQKSKINKHLISAIDDLEGVTINNLYENYPDFFIQVKKEQELLLNHDIIVWHHPFYWYSAPAIIKEWMDLVLQHGFAYGKQGKTLVGKKAFSVITTGGIKKVYCEEGKNHYTINQFLAPFHQSANLCGMEYLPPFVVHGSHTIKADEIVDYSTKYRNIIIGLRDETFVEKEIQLKEYLNELMDKNV